MIRDQTTCRKCHAPPEEPAESEEPRKSSGCCATALERLYDRTTEEQAAMSVLAQYIEDGADQSVIDYLADIVLCLGCQVDELESIRDAEC